ncbi:MAG TPA: hypothetical protein VGX03_26975 [Candidatus Binatia bacterium]|nr:hypothetical protein [Candidatus Binatia bacterium]
MRRWRTAFAIVLVLGLTSLPFPAHAQKEGSRSGQEAHDQQGKQVRGDMQQETGAKREAKKDHVMEQRAPETHHDRHGGHHDRHEQAEEGSH